MFGFSFNVTDTNAVYDLLLDVKHDAEFPNQNCYTLIKTRYPNGKVLTQQVSLELASAQGAWYGDCGSSWCTLHLPIQERAYFNLPGKYDISLQQYNRMDTLRGIRNIGLMVKKIGDRRDTAFVKPSPQKSKKE
ncbi:MAG: gliding motility lipoprotein GldH [Spirosomaceae bacterium]|nr:gliding motility lipoprotein GldH [Spirosomataceae bacterium]